MDTWSQNTLRSLSLEEKVGQLLCVRIQRWLPQVKEMLAKGQIGGASVTTSDVKGKSAAEIAAFNNELQQLSPLPVLLTSEHEGIYSPVSSATKLVRAMALGASQHPDDVEDWARIIARECCALGMPWIHAPVLDVNTNSANPIINTRSYGERADVVADIGARIVAAAQEEGALAQGKHFPGHGDTSVDSHLVTAEVPFGLTRLRAVEWSPYRAAIAAGMGSVMTAHIRFPGVDNTTRPATLSRYMITGILREELRFEGIIVTDSMTMRGVKAEFGIEKAAVLALQAGHDMILHDYQSDPNITYQAMLQAVRAGEVPMEQIDASVLRVLQAKERLRLHINRLADPMHAQDIVGCQAHQDIAARMAQNSMTLLENNDYPLRPASTKKVLFISTENEQGPILSEDLGAEVKSRGGMVLRELRRHIGQIEQAVVFDAPAPKQRAAALEQAAAADYVVFASFVPLASYLEGSGTVPPAQKEFMKELRRVSRHLSIVIYGGPYVLADFPKADITLCAYGNEPCAVVASVQALCGEIVPQGKLPVTVSPEYPYGSGY